MSRSAAVLVAGLLFGTQSFADVCANGIAELSATPVAVAAGSDTIGVASREGQSVWLQAFTATGFSPVGPMVFAGNSAGPVALTFHDGSYFLFTIPVGGGVVMTEIDEAGALLGQRTIVTGLTSGESALAAESGGGEIAVAYTSRSFPDEGVYFVRVTREGLAASLRLAMPITPRPHIDITWLGVDAGWAFATHRADPAAGESTLVARVLPGTTFISPRIEAAGVRPRLAWTGSYLLLTTTVETTAGNERIQIAGYSQDGSPIVPPRTVIEGAVKLVDAVWSDSGFYVSWQDEAAGRAVLRRYTSSLESFVDTHAVSTLAPTRFRQVTNSAVIGATVYAAFEDTTSSAGALFSLFGYCQLRASISGPTIVKAREPFTLTGSAEGGVGPHYLYWEIDQGIRIVGEGETLTLRFDDTGLHEVRLIVVDRLGDRTLVRRIIQVVADIPPLNASIVVEKASIGVGELLALEGVASGGAGALTYDWTIPGQGSLSGQRITVSFPSLGTRTIELRITDGAGQVALASVTIEVAGARRRIVAR
ncbi:MAG TPA: hypothetical protein VM557_02275 [Thermoanaerobaculia bacterium]|nr:hypothetical protein [Thermoanaerobaculia bacterium]